MPLLAIILIIISAAMHVGWNLISKRQQPSAAFFMIANAMGVAMLLPALLLPGRLPLSDVPAQIWWLLGLTSFCMAVYSAALAGAYRCGQMSVAYPVARAMPVILVALVASSIGHSVALSWQSITGSVLVAGGCLLLPLLRFSELRLSNYRNLSCALALLAALGTVGYSLIDYDALQLLNRLRAPGVSTLLQTLLYAGLETGLCALWLGLFVAVRRRERHQLRELWHGGLRQAVLAGHIMYLGYLLVLIALTLVTNVSYVVSFRQLSIPLGAACAIIFLKEPASHPKTAGVAIVFIGLLLVVTG
ncbi:EamA family transporter [Dongshaea marina]|uniref:multidrug DMT transporter permease n=1 Tax=Dongshaea marina TaxID=2047966 RepID=UPI000D3E124E|nr:multidrug DMT transporter permease [Dongshaea marina]